MQPTMRYPEVIGLALAIVAVLGSWAVLIREPSVEAELACAPPPSVGSLERAMWNLHCSQTAERRVPNPSTGLAERGGSRDADRDSLAMTEHAPGDDRDCAPSGAFTPRLRRGYGAQLHSVARLKHVSAGGPEPARSVVDARQCERDRPANQDSE